MNAEDAYLSSFTPKASSCSLLLQALAEMWGVVEVVTWSGTSRVSDHLLAGKWLVRMMTGCQASGMSQPLESSDQ